MRKWFPRLLIAFILATAILTSIWVGKIYFSKVAEIDDTFVTNVSKNTTASPKQSGSPIFGKEIPGLPEYCADKLISVSGCDGMTEITTEQGNTYRLVEIGNQCWFADNLKEIPTTDKGWYGYYDNAAEEPSPGEGLLYTWDAAMNGEDEERAQGLCPEGWNIPAFCDSKQNLFRAYPFYGSGYFNKSQNIFSQLGSGNFYWTSSTAGQLNIYIFATSTGTSPTLNPFVTIDRDNVAFNVKCIRDQ